MRVISKIKDYYDYTCYTPNDTIVYERNLNGYKRIIEKKKVSFNKNKYSYKEDKYIYDKETLDNLNKVFRKYLKRNQSIIVIGDLVIPFIHKSEGDFQNKKDFFFYSYEEYELFIKDKKDKLNINLTEIKYFMEQKDFSDILKEIRKISLSPVITYCSSYSNLYSTANNAVLRSGTNIDSILKEFKLQDYLPGNIVSQEISMFLNRLKCNEKNIEFSDKDKIKAAGFNKESFRRNK
jgi:hypothetical protein